MNHGTGVGKLDGGGSYVTLISPDSKQLTLVIETMVSLKFVFILLKLFPTLIKEPRSFGMY